MKHIVQMTCVKLFIFFILLSLGVFGQSDVGTSKRRGVEYSFKTDGAIRCKPAVDGTSIYFGSGDGTFYALNKTTGQELWRFKTDGPIFSSPSVSGRLIYFTSKDGFLYALHIGNGKLAWKYKFGALIGEQIFWEYYISSPVIEGLDLFVGAVDGYLHSLDARTGKLNWKYNANSRIRSTPAVSKNIIVFGTMKGYVIALDKNGKEVWAFATEGVNIPFDKIGLDNTSIFSDLRIKNDIVTVAGRDFILYALNLQSGKELWRYNHPNSWVLFSEMTDSLVLAGSGVAAFVHASDAKTGKQLWKFKTRSAVWSSFTFADGLVYFGDLSGSVFGVDVKTGKQRWLFPMGTSSFSTPVVSDGLVYCSSENGTLYAVHGVSGTDESFSNSKKVVYWEGNLTPQAYRYFTFNVDLWIRDFLIRNDYELMNSEQLKSFMTTRLTDASKSVVVFADNKVPLTIIEEKSNQALIRKYLDAGGKIVFLGANPLFPICDPTTGQLLSFSINNATSIFDIEFSPQQDGYGLHHSRYTQDGNRWGLFGHSIGFWPVKPKVVSNVLSLDENGNTSSWLKNFGGPEGSGLLQLCVTPPRALGPDFYPMLMAIEFGIGW